MFLKTCWNSKSSINQNNSYKNNKNKNKNKNNVNIKFFHKTRFSQRNQASFFVQLYFILFIFIIDFID